ncbi:DUF6116 family protein [Luteimonas vadosa]|uniref:DUF6116 family protein n=1 Tax=Luteimonas vadosa TaxID=1165507 RepID=UPI0031F1C1A1
MPNPLLTPILRWLGRLSYPRLFMLTAGLFVADLLIPDFIPLVDEILLGLGTLLLANWKNRKAPGPQVASRDDTIEGDSRRH